ncbi:class I adenylate-forming enzyme family protein [Sphingomicrobium nitratireducens]|uniref:class I adenylate-forming enzyme family protein n=1 Tax=Sphingomicrobium nitratireducens TaxID=2964666 RepID=UPI00224013DE|nr:class I adenylate-forming enzyme family protein [Sphingomicrobium nitratireducens]
MGADIERDWDTLAQAIGRHEDARVAVRLPGGAIDLARFRADIAATTSWLRRQGVGPGKRVAVGFPADGRTMAYQDWLLLLGTILSGARHTSVGDPATYHALAESGPIDAAVGDLPPDAKDPIGFAMSMLEDHRDATWPPDPGLETEAVRINLTSGTTGRAKLVEWDHAMLCGRIAQLLGDVGPDDVLVSQLLPRTTAGFRYPLAVWAAGGTVALADENRQPVIANEATVSVMSPVQLRNIVNQGARVVDPGNRRILLFGGRLPRQVGALATRRLAHDVRIHYGSTETGNISSGAAQFTARHPGAVGHVREGVTVEIVDPAGNPVPPGTIGSLRAKTPLMVEGYAARPDDTSQGSFRDGWFQPGDLAILFEDGLLAIEGRASDTLNVGGWKLNAPDAEERLAEIEGVEDAACVVLQLPGGDRLGVAAIAEGPETMKKVRAVIAQIAPKTVPTMFVRVTHLPRNAMGKLPRLQIAQQMTQTFLNQRSKGSV